MCHPITSLVSSVECVFSNTCTVSSASWLAQQWNLYQQLVCASLDCSVHVSTWWSAYPSERSKHSSMWCVGGLTRSLQWWSVALMYSVSIIRWRHFLFNINSNSVFVVKFSCTHEFVFVVFLQNLWLVWPPRFAQWYCIRSVAVELAYHFLDSFTWVH